MEYIPIEGDATPAWLTAVLRQANILVSGVVTALETIPTGSFNSNTTRLLVSYSLEGSLSIPRQWVLKRNTAESWSVQAGVQEVRFYQSVAKLDGHPKVIPPCWAAAYRETNGSSYLLLVDLSETHAPLITREQQIGIIEGVPELEHQLAVFDTLARLHAYWWENPWMEGSPIEVGYWSLDVERFNAYLAKRLTAWQGLLDRESSWLSADWLGFYEWLFTRLPGCWETHLRLRLQARKHLTLIHGDTYFCNFLCPKVPDSAPAYLMDWQSYSFDLGAYDLVDLLACFWTRQQRREEEREQRLLERYLDNLHANGVQDYNWDDLRLDYRLGLIFWITMPLQDAQDGAGKDYWWVKMGCLRQAFEDWECAELLG